MLDVISDLVLASIDHAAEAARQRAASRRRGSGIGDTLRPGPDTALWNALVERVKPLLGRYGSQALLARELNLPRQRVHDFIFAKSRMPDAERVLKILVWVIQQESEPGELARRGAARAKARGQVVTKSVTQ